MEEDYLVIARGMGCLQCAAGSDEHTPCILCESRATYLRERFIPIGRVMRLIADLEEREYPSAAVEVRRLFRSDLDTAEYKIKLTETPKKDKS